MEVKLKTGATPYKENRNNKMITTADSALTRWFVAMIHRNSFPGQQSGVKGQNKYTHALLRV